MADQDAPVTVARTAHELEAAALVGNLAAQGIEARTTGEWTAAFRAETAGEVEIVVRRRDERRALEVLAEAEASRKSSPTPLTHFDEQGASRMVDVGAKPITRRVARASGVVRLQPETLRLIVDRGHAKGDVMEVARLAGIMAAKRTSELIPLCHPLPLESIHIAFTPEGSDALRIVAVVEVSAKTGVEMEALTAVSVAALTVYDMCKAVDRGMAIEQVQLDEKSGGASGQFSRKQ